jgi:hypothetical protein
MNTAINLKSALENLIAEVRASLNVDGIIPLRRIYLEGGLYYLQQLQSLVGDMAAVPGGDIKVRRIRTRASGLKDAAMDAVVNPSGAAPAD